MDEIVVFIVEAISTDLSILDVRVSPASVIYDEMLSFRWRLQNNGSLLARGYKCDSIFLSEDIDWDLSDYEIGVPRCGGVSLYGTNSNQNNELSLSRSAVAPFIAQSQYYGIVRTRTNIRDPNLSNNIGSSATQIEINAPQLILGRTTTVTFDGSGTKVFRIVGIPEDEALIATLTTRQNNVYHDLFLRSRQTPTGAEHDALAPAENARLHECADDGNEDQHNADQKAG